MLYLGAFLLSFVRVAAFMQSAPLVGDQGTPPRIRVAISVFIAALLAPLRATIPVADIAMMLPGEAILGLAFGFASRLGLFGIETGGQLIGLQLELGFAGNFDPLAKEEALPTRRLASTLGMLAFLATNGLELTLRGLLRVPPPSTMHAASLGTVLARLVDATGEVTIVGLRLTAPLLVAGVTLNLALALGTRAAPALNVFSVMLAAMLMLGGFVLIGTAPSFVHETWLAAARSAVAGTQLLGR